MSHATRLGNRSTPDAGHLDDLKLAAAKMLGAKRRAFQAEMAVKYCAGSPRQAEVLFGWSRHAVELGLHEKRTGIVCLSAQSAVAGDKLWEQKHPDVAKIAFTGSTNTGRKIIEYSAANIKKIQLELGGKGANIVFDDANLDQAAAGAQAAVFSGAGQSCTAGSRARCCSRARRRRRRS